MATIGDPLVDLAWAMIFHPEPGEPMPPRGAAATTRSTVDGLPSEADLLARYADRHRARPGAPSTGTHVFSRWKLAIVLEGSYAKWQRGESTKPVHEYFGPQADLLLDSALAHPTEGDSR